ncbi:hypothetical protein CAPN001_23510 [Capnocytophaga stomatis]|uniref:hypothetical protein n=1 Tax=Capnocytophaga stomatis TaxID=1848904 RepID=UPI001A5B17FE|nr:hypothetical protein [Capnocytophaga stomatis]GIJ97782.1 hypothetical protein CAPN001_23510 [Capnocytophaga stomatis]
MFHNKIEYTPNSEGTNIQNLARTGKRKLAKKESFLADMSEQELTKFFTAIDLAEKSYNEIMRNFPPQSRCRGLEASVLNSCIIDEVQKQFPDKCKFLKYKRFALMYKGYIFLFKKLDKKGIPMNIKTQSSEAIANQMQTCLFDPKDYENPIVFFGYQENKSGMLHNPHFVYIDDGHVKWRLIEEEIPSRSVKTIGMSAPSETLLPKIKENKKKKKAV